LLDRAVAAVAGTGVGLYIVLNQDLSHGEGHGGHGEHHDTPVKQEAVDDSASEETKEEAKEEKEEISEDVKEGKRMEGGDKPKPEAATQEQSDEKPSETDKVRCVSNALSQSKLT
jgi:hypothetical protein